MKDYFDLWTLAINYEYKAQTLMEAIRATLVRRGRKLPEDIPVGLQEEFVADPSKQAYWKAFIERAAPEQSSLELANVLATLREFFETPLRIITGNSPSNAYWPAGGPWKKTD